MQQFQDRLSDEAPFQVNQGLSVTQESELKDRINDETEKRQGDETEERGQEGYGSSLPNLPESHQGPGTDCETCMCLQVRHQA